MAMLQLSVHGVEKKNRARTPIRRAELSKEAKCIRNDCVKFGVRVSS